MRKTLLRCFAIAGAVLVSAFAYAQTSRTVTGNVSDSEGFPLPGVNVIIQGTTTGTITNADGFFSLEVPSPETSTLNFSFIGFQQKSLVIGNQSTFDVVLENDFIGLDEVVAVGYGVIRKRDLTGSVASISTSEITKVASTNAMQSMQGRVAGVDITRSSGEAGAPLKIDMRGNRSINASNNPLIIVDGVEYGSTLDINASDIESMEILKDASSTAIYGTRGANGVILITTKRGTAGQASRVTYNGYFSSNSPTNLPPVMSAHELFLFRAERERFETENTDKSWGSTDINDYSPSTMFESGVSAPWTKSMLDMYNEGGVDWMDLILRNSVSQNHEVSVSGGSEKTNFMLSLGYTNEQGLLRKDELQRYNGRLNIDHQLSTNVKVGASIQYTLRDWDRREDGVFGQAIKMQPIAQVWDDNGELIDTPSPLVTSHTNPLLNEVEGYYQNNTEAGRFFGSTYLEWDIIKNLQFKSILGVDQHNSRKGIYEDYMSTRNYQFGRGSNFEVNNSRYINLSLENTLNYKYDFNYDTSLQLLAGQSALKNVSEFYEVSGAGEQDHYGKSGFRDLSYITPGNRAVSNGYVKQTMLSYFGRANVRLLNKYLLTASVRADGSSVLSEGNKWGYFPSVAGAWIVSEEGFMRDISQIDNLKLRLSWGKSGNAAVNPYQTLTALGEDRVYYTFGNSLFTGLTPGILGNSDLSWEITTSTNIGFDFSILNQRLNFTVDYYVSNTTDLLLNKRLPATSTYPQVITNIGETENKGIEIALNARIVNTNDFSWTTDFTYAANRDKIVSLASGLDRDVSNPNEALVVGEPVRAFYHYESDGIWSIDEATEAAAFDRIPGQLKIKDQNDDGIIDDEDKILYNKSPKFIFGMNNNVDYKNFSLSVLVYARVGQWIDYELNTLFRPTEQDASPRLDYWTPENQGAKFPRPGIVSQTDLPILAFEKASFLKIKDITLSYKLPKTTVNQIGIENIRVYGSLQNYFTFSNLENYDAERGGQISNPLAKHMVFGLNVTF